MGRSYWFECARCGYRAKVSGRADRGLNLYVQTILCRECKALYDAVIRLRVPKEPARSIGPGRLLKVVRSASSEGMNGKPPSFEAALNRLTYAGLRRFIWVDFRLQCPVGARHHVRSWSEPDKCPRCGLYLERTVLPYRIWE